MSGHSKWSSIKHKKGARGREARQALLQALARDHRRGARRRARSRRQRDPCDRDPEGARQLDAEGQHRARDRTRCRHILRRRGVRAHHVRGLRPERRCALRRGAHGQPKPDGVGRAPHLHEERRLPRRVRLRRLALRAEGRDPRARLGRRGRAHARRGRRGSGGRRPRRVELRGDLGAGRTAGRAGSARRRPGSATSPPISRCFRRRRSPSRTRARRRSS